MLTPEILDACTGCSIQTATKWFDVLDQAMHEFGIDSPEEQAMFISQVAHESDLFRFTHELWGPTPEQRRYAGRADLGNTRPEAIAFARAAGFSDVGKFYRGHGLIQVTGYTNHARTAARLGIDCAAHPELLETPLQAARSAGDFWQDHNLSRFVTDNDFKGLTHAINGGYNGLENRERLWELSKVALEVA